MSSKAKTGWTTPADLKARVQKLWDRGTLPASMVEENSLFPLRLTLKGPGSRQLSENFTDVRSWISQLRSASGPYRIVWRTVNHRVLGSNDIPSELWIDTIEDALGLIGKQDAASTFMDMISLTRQKEPALLPWLSKRPMQALELSASWPLLLQIVAWLRAHPRPGIYPRQIDLPGVHSKFIEQHRGVLSELFDLVLPPDAIDTQATGTINFCRRYGFRDKPLRVRFRLLDPDIDILPSGTDQDITITTEAFARLDIPVRTIFITENEINFLAFPPVKEAMVIFGAGYGFRNLAGIDWLHDRNILYWGDIDTHGFAILNQLREYLPHAESFLMDRDTLFAHRPLWGTENNPETATLTRLTAEERSLYDDLRNDKPANRLRLEQERIAFQALLDALEKLSHRFQPNHFPSFNESFHVRDHAALNEKKNAR
ncbi:DUF3322 domain-containing protein [Prosthecochloris sp. HL-130-GSB]|jgi:hypothetical protein|uniref:DUF3322 domain-containing protein n=1 Tax=Prosthecochloris sp. HL-130-GSB TaxID=1974213 RepID=UPI000A1C1973|nr:DUF3322 domain-containing protein [Prosthecochloris sp. HL-130-GSB]ARM31312.1 hypothetical protein B9H02_08420 [Prosthecochloris sp. HL-130-GSB]